MGVKGQKMAQDEEKILSVAVDISRTIYHMIFFSIFQILIPWVVKGGGGGGGGEERGVKGPKSSIS